MSASEMSHSSSDDKPDVDAEGIAEELAPAWTGLEGVEIDAMVVYGCRGYGEVQKFRREILKV